MSDPYTTTLPIPVPLFVLLMAILAMAFAIIGEVTSNHTQAINAKLISSHRAHWTVDPVSAKLTIVWDDHGQPVWEITP